MKGNQLYLVPLQVLFLMTQLENDEHNVECKPMTIMEISNNPYHFKISGVASFDIRCLKKEPRVLTSSAFKRIRSGATLDQWSEKSIEEVTETISVEISFEITTSSDICILAVTMGSVKTSIVIKSLDAVCLYTGRENYEVTVG